MSRPIVTTGDDVRIVVQLRKDGAAFDLTGATVRARLASVDRATNYTAAVAQSAGAAGAAWGTSLVVIEMPAAETAGITVQGPAVCQVQADQGGKKLSWHVDVEIVRGVI